MDFEQAMFLVGQGVVLARSDFHIIKDRGIILKVLCHDVEVYTASDEDIDAKDWRLYG